MGGKPLESSFTGTLLRVQNDKSSELFATDPAKSPLPKMDLAKILGPAGDGNENSNII